MDISEREVRSLMRMVTQSVREKFGAHHQIDDILGAAFRGMWEALLEVDQTHACSREAAARRGGLSAAIDWLRGPENEGRRHTRRGNALPRRLVLETTHEEEEEVPEKLRRRRAYYLPQSSDFAPALISDLDNEGRIEAWLARGTVTPLEWEIVRRTLLEGELAVEVAYALGIGYERLLAVRKGAVQKLIQGEQERGENE